MATINTKRGDSFRASFAFADGAVAANLTGCEARMQLRNQSDAVLVDVSTTDYISIDGAAGIVYVDVPGASMELTPGTYFGDIQLTFSDGTILSSKTFIVKILKDITRS